MTVPLISIIVPVYNVEKYIDKCISSILQQTYPRIELLLIDDGSPDKSGIICDMYAQKDNRVRVFHKPNAGVSAARNTGINNAKGEFITFVDSDDWLEPDCIRRSLNIINKNELDLLQFSSKRINDKGDLLFLKTGETPILNASQYIEADQIYIAAGCSIYRTSIIRSTNLKFDENLKLGEDQLFIYRYISKCKSCMRIKDSLYNYRLNPESACTVNNPRECLKSMKTFQTFELRPSFERNIQRGILRYFLYPIIEQRFLPAKKVYQLTKDEYFNLLKPNRKFEYLFFNLYKANRFIGILYLYMLLPYVNKKLQ